MQKDLFAVPVQTEPLILTLKRIPAPRRLGKERKESQIPLPPNYHIPSFKNSKQLITRTPRGKLLDRPLLITSPEYREWMAKAVASLESQLLSMCRTGAEETPPEHLKLFAMLSRLPADDSVNDLPEGSWKVERVTPGEEGAKIEIERIT